MQTTALNYFLKRIGSFCLILPAVWFTFVCVWGSLMDTKYRKNLIYPYSGLGYLNLRLNQADTTRNIDLLVLGSSHAYRGVDTRILKQHGIEAFNLGSSLQTPVQTEFLLKKYLPKMKPKIVLFEVGFKTFSSDGVESAVDILSHVDQFDKNLLEMVFSINDIAVYNSLAFAFFRKKILGKDSNDQLSNDGENKYITGGFVEKINGEYEGPESFRKARKPIEGKQKRAFEACLNYLHKNNVKVILMQAPILYDYYLSIENKQEYDQYFVQKASMYINFSDSTYANKEFFYDHHHLNQKGVRKFNKALINSINSHFQKILPVGAGHHSK